MAIIKVILIDDHQLFLEGLKLTLNTDATIQVTQTFNKADKALTFLKQHTVDLVITDISMPDVNGIEFIKKLKQFNTTNKVLVISMFKPIHYEKSFYDGYLLKETESNIVIQAIKSIVLDNKSFFIYEKEKIDTFNFTTNIITKREREVISLITEELTVEEIAERLFLSRHTIETHKKNIFFKLQVKNNAGLIRKALILGVIS